MENNSNSESYKLQSNIILRQELKSITPKCDIKFISICLILLKLIFFILGIPILISTSSINEIIIDYTDCNYTNIDSIPLCKVSFELKENWNPPIYLYYGLNNFFSNHRDFVKSKSYPQLRDKTDSKNYEKCKGAKFIKEIFDKKVENGYDPNDIAFPCGLVAKAFFQDSYTLSFGDGNNIFIDESNIANNYDKSYLFKNSTTKKQWLNIENEHFINWMQMESQSSFRKLWGKIDTNLKVGNYTISIRNNYDVMKFQGNKSVTLLTSSGLGYSSFYGWIMVVSIIICAFMLIIINGFKFVKKPILYDYDDLKWQ